MEEQADQELFIPLSKNNNIKITLNCGTILTFDEAPMISISSFEQIYFYKPYVDFRKGINGLCSVVQDEMELNPFKIPFKEKKYNEVEDIIEI